MVNIFFLALYAVLPGILSSVEMSYLLSIHCIINIILHFRTNKKELVTPILVFYVGVILVNYANISLIGDYVHRALRKNNYLVPAYIDEAIQIWCISVCFIIMGYSFNIKKSLPSIALELNNKKVFRILFWILLLANLQLIFLPSLGLNFLTLNKYFKLLNTFSVLFYARLWTKENSKMYRMYALSLYTAVTFVALKTSFLRLDLILPTVSLFSGYFIGKGNIKYVFTYRLIPFIIIIALYSSVFRSLQANRANFYAVVFEGKKEEASDESSKSGTGLVDRSSNLSQLTSVLKLVKQNGFYEGKASQPLVAALIPRFLWPDKPSVALGAWFALEITGTRLEKGAKANNSINMTSPGELFLDFGWIGLIIGSFLTGAFFPLLWNSTRFYSSEYNLMGIIFGGYLFIIAISCFGADLQIIISLLSLYLTFLIVKRVAGKL